MTSERSKRRDFLSLVFILKSISKKLLIEILLWILGVKNMDGHGKRTSTNTSWIEEGWES